MTTNKTNARIRRRPAWPALVVGMLLMAANAGAEPARNRILDQLHLTEQGACAMVRVGFTLPVRYVRHFPYNTGNELRIKLDPISVSDLDRSALTMRESLRPDRGVRLPLYEVVYEGDMEGGPFLTLEFHRSVRFAVRQGSDFRSVLIAVSLEGGQAPAHACPFETMPGR